MYSGAGGIRARQLVEKSAEVWLCAALCSRSVAQINPLRYAQLQLRLIRICYFFCHTRLRMDSCPAWHQRSLIQPLAQLRKGTRGIVSAVTDAAGDGVVKVGDAAGSTLARRLIELGFVVGEAIEVIEEVRPGGDPIAVRIGSSMFALRRREAQAVLVQLAAP
jgi:ferrous iron transport protein A